MTFATALAPTGPSFGERLTAFRAALAERALQRRTYRTTLAELDALSDRDLSDLGLARADIARVARGAFPA